MNCIEGSDRISGEGRLARSMISELTRHSCHCPAAAFKSARRSAAAASSFSPVMTARISRRSHSTNVRSDAATSSARRSASRTAFPAGSPSSHASTALDSAERFNASHVLPRGVRRRCGASAAARHSNRPASPRRSRPALPKRRESQPRGYSPRRNKLRDDFAAVRHQHGLAGAHFAHKFAQPVLQLAEYP